MQITRPHPKILKLKRSRIRHFLYLALTLAFVGIWYGYVPGMGAKGDKAITSEGLLPTDVFEIFILLVPLALIPWMIRWLKVILRGEETIFDGANQRILINGDPVASFDDIERLQIKVRAGEDQSDLIIVLRQGGTLNIDSASYRSIAALSEAVGEIVGHKAQIG